MSVFSVITVIFVLSVLGLKGGTGGGGGANGPGFTYTFQGDPHAMFTEFFGGRNPFESIFTMGGMGGLGGMGADDMDVDEPFRGFGLGGRQPFSGRQEKKQDPPVTHELHVSLEEVLKGCTKKMKISRRRLDPDGRGTRMEDKLLTVEVKKGWKEGTKITFPKEGDQTATNIPADVVFIVKDKPHPVFKRDGSDIIYPAKVTLKEVTFMGWVLVNLVGDRSVLTVMCICDYLCSIIIFPNSSSIVHP